MGRDTCGKLRKIIRLCHIVVTAGLKSGDLVFQLVFCRKEDDRSVRVNVDLGRKIICVSVREHNVQNDTVIRICFHLLKRLRNVCSNAYVVAFIRQKRTVDLQNVGIVVNQ